MKRDLDGETHDLRCALSLSSTSATTGKYIPGHDEKEERCVYEELSARNSIDLVLQKDEQEAQVHLSTAVFLEPQVDTLIPPYRALLIEPNTGQATDLLGYVSFSSVRSCKCTTLCETFRGVKGLFKHG